MDLTDAQWAAIAPILPTPKLRKDRRGRPWRDPRDALNGVLWVLRTGAPWADMPARYPSYATCFRRFQAWTEDGIFAKILHRLAEDLLARGKLDLSETFIDGTHAGAKKGGSLWAALVKAYDSAKLQASLANQHIDLISPTRARSRVRKQDGRKLRRYRRRWKV